MAITEDEVRKIAKLARLRLADGEAQLYQGQFSRILGLMTELSAVDTSLTAATFFGGGEPSGSHDGAAVVERPNVLRPDDPRPFSDPQRLLALAPERDGDYYKVRKVIE
ncbi:MAG TPA: Asp-tRNA(Asn)/Glu-tRNA(Gln) amidotransferase subunit GatC [Elusimicrobia bacterium]|nr:Asp-tRNA(Asn)/Glu-tRNA(Gln) amidotransferase subunit GatC [Elusimicrobiota bacterium]HBT62089.1 Asp-tRNA(Asn)/Glu-tRNA(Gln) amidotransferase subunit GatC [Elusimicrobiota bacterium]